MSVTQAEPAVHDVLFSESDVELVGVAGERLASALAAGSGVIVIATPEHREAFAGAMRARGVAADRALEDGSLVMLDAAETLGRLTRGGVFNPAEFDHVVGTLVRETAADRRVQAFGEMVGLLWADGRYEEAIELEAAWEDLIAETSISLLCAYPGILFEDPQGAAGLPSICGLHSAVVADLPFERTWQFPPHRTAAGRARRAVANALRARGVDETTFYDAQSVLGELVANALVHAGSPFSVEIRVDREQVLLRVGDQSTADVAVRDPNPLRSGVSGLRLVDELADRWGVEQHEGGKSIWVELER